MKNKDIKGFYNKTIEEKYKNDYEFKRWFSSERLRTDFFMTYAALRYHLKDLEFQKCLELGPGPGTWTRVLHKHQPGASFELVDISEEMRRQFNLEMRGGDKVSYHVEDIMEFEPSDLYDFFFSSRAVEYLDDEEGFFSKLGTFMTDGAQGIIITKNSYYNKLFKRDTRAQHQSQLTPDECRRFLEKNNFCDIEIYPVIIRVPLIDRASCRLSSFLFRKLMDRPLVDSFLSRLTVESYLVKFRK